MSGEWIKMRGNLGDDPAVIAIAAALRINADEVVGKLHRLWWWADQNTASGEIAWVSAAWIDEHVRKRGFAAAMQKVGWLVIGSDSITFPEFDRHNGASAKARALDKNRKDAEREAEREAERLSKLCPDGNRTDVRNPSGSEPDKNRTREEKKDLHQSQNQEQSRAGATPAAQKAPRGTRLPETWTLPDDWKAWALAERQDWNEATVIGVSLLFRDHWRGKGEARADWLATWRNWVRREHSTARGPPAKLSREPTLAERRTATVDEITGKKSNGRDITSTAERVDQPPIPALPIDVREPDGDDVGRLRPR